MHRTVTAVRLEQVDPTSRTDKFYTVYTFELDDGSYAIRSHYGARSSKGTLTRPDRYPTQMTAADARAQMVREKERKGYRPVVQWLSFGIPSAVDPVGPVADVLPVVGEAFAAAWREKETGTITELSRLARTPRTPEVLAAGSVVTFANLAGQVATQPWGPALAEALDGLPCVEGKPGNSPYVLTLVLAPADLAEWAYSRYQHGLRGPARHPNVAASSRDDVEVLATTMSLWTPLDPSGPYRSLETALDTARLILAPPA